MTTGGDTMGDADEWADQLDDDESLAPGSQPFLTPEARAFTGAGLILTGLLGTTLFQILTFLVLSNNNGNAERWQQYALYAGPAGVLALAGAVIAWPVHRQPVSRLVHGLASAVVIIGLVIAIGVVAGLVAVANTHPNANF
jgi:pheromone shutdown protein TraB